MTGLAVMLITPTIAGALLLVLAGLERLWTGVRPAPPRWKAHPRWVSVAYGSVELLLGTGVTVMLLRPEDWTVFAVLGQALLYTAFAAVAWVRADGSGRRSCGCSAHLDVLLHRRASPVFLRAASFAAVSAACPFPLPAWRQAIEAGVHGALPITILGGAALALLAFVFPFVRTPARIMITSTR